MAKSKKQRQRILLLDDEQDLLDLYRDILQGLHSQPEVHTTSSGAQAINILQSEFFNLLICDLSMPKMDGLQVLAIVRRKFPRLRTAILTSVADEQFRARAYAMGVDLFLEKPSTPGEIKLMMDCVESLLDQEAQEGFRGLQSKSLVDIIQMEGLSQSSSTLTINNGRQQGQIWFINGDIVDAATESLQGEEAFFRILSWKTGHFEAAAPDLRRPRRIQASYHALLLESARAIDESGGRSEVEGEAAPTEPTPDEASAIHFITRRPGVEFVLSRDTTHPEGLEYWRVENPGQTSQWSQDLSRGLNELGEFLNAGALERVEGLGVQKNVALRPRHRGELCVGFHRTLSHQEIERAMNAIMDQETVC